jgi:sortase A
MSTDLQQGAVRRRGLAEYCAWTAGLGLLLLYFATRVWSEQARLDGIRHVASPDQSLWSEQRVRAFAESALNPGMPEGVLSIPSIHLEVPIYPGSSEINLNRGAAHIEGTSGLTEGGNVGIAGHRDGFFRNLKDLLLDADILLQVREQVLHYRVVEIRVVTPEQADVLAPTKVPSLTLVTCYPFYFVGSAPQRYIVRAELFPP